MILMAKKMSQISHVICISRNTPFSCLHNSSKLMLLLHGKGNCSRVGVVAMTGPLQPCSNSHGRAPRVICMAVRQKDTPQSLNLFR